MSSGRSVQLQPPDGCPTEEANNSNRRTGAQRKKDLSLQPLNEAEEEELITPTIGPRCVRRAYHSALAASLVGDHSVQPGLRERPPGF